MPTSSSGSRTRLFKDFVSIPASLLVLLFVLRMYAYDFSFYTTAEKTLQQMPTLSMAAQVASLFTGVETETFAWSRRSATTTKIKKWTTKLLRSYFVFPILFRNFEELLKPYIW